MYSSLVEPIVGECDFCKIQGVLEKSIINRDGWFFCRPCLSEIEAEMERRKQLTLLGKN